MHLEDTVGYGIRLERTTWKATEHPTVSGPETHGGEMKTTNTTLL